MAAEDPEIQRLLNHAEEFYSLSLSFFSGAGRRYQLLHVLIFCSQSKRLHRSRNMILPRPQRQAKYG
ncbi:hypothetical protein DPMN_005575 [Dreissena polymorpha]|uniref:Uncharacterized protein n=1 Tax=Dreissena polymorpha TaxID=45954 RepID=A0A9D4MTU5_DREPO|nr:hypothetical protein DPMN_005575 [Dreissena polymorpha]